MPQPVIAVTMGDPAGIGPEICLALLNHAEMCAHCVPVVFGDAGVLRRVSRQTGQPLEARVLSLAEWPLGHARCREPVVLDLQCIPAEAVSPGRVDPRCGDAAFRYVIASIEAALRKEVDAVATAPLNKEALHAAGHRYPGHTEIFAERLRAKRSCMMLTSPQLTCSFVTVHVGYRDVPGLLSVQRILDVVELTHEALVRIRGRTPKLIACGLNPHAGEKGLFGQREEERLILPALEQARHKGIAIEGPLPPDTAFLPQRRAVTDGVVCMYHDQGHIPLKALAFDSAINTTLGLPVVRTSVDHGTAFDIAWQGRANPQSLFQAVRLAARLAGTENPRG